MSSVGCLATVTTDEIDIAVWSAQCRMGRVIAAGVEWFVDAPLQFKWIAVFVAGKQLNSVAPYGLQSITVD